MKLTIYPDVVYFFNHEDKYSYEHEPRKKLLDARHTAGEVHVHHYHGVRTEKFTGWGRGEQVVAIPWNHVVVDLLLPDSIKERMINENTDDS